MPDKTPDETEDKNIIPPEEQRRDGNTINQSAQQIDPAGRHRVDVNANAKAETNTKQPGQLPSDQRDEEAVREADPEDKKSPPK